MREEQQVLNMLHGLNSKYNHAISSTTAKDPLHSFLQARSTLLLEELCKLNEEKQPGCWSLQR